MAGSLQMALTPDTANKIPKNLRIEVVRRIAEYWTNQQIVEWLKHEHGIEVSSSAITHYRKSDQWQDEIHRAKVAFNTAIDDVPGASARWRMEQITKLYTQAEKDNDTRSGRAECMRILRQAADECPAPESMGSNSSIQINVPDWAAPGIDLLPREIMTRLED